MYRYIQGHTDQLRRTDGVIGRKTDRWVQCDQEITKIKAKWRKNDSRKG